MTSIAKFFFLSLTIIFTVKGSCAFASEVMGEEARTQKGLTIRKDTTIIIEKYLKETDTYVLRIETEPDVGPNITTLEWLLRAIDNDSKVSDYKRAPSRLVDGYFKLKKTLWLLSNEEIAARRSKAKKQLQK